MTQNDYQDAYLRGAAAGRREAYWDTVHYLEKVMKREVFDKVFPGEASYKILRNAIKRTEKKAKEQ